MPETQLGVHPPRAYETIYVLRPDVAKEAATKVSHRVQEVVEREGGKLTLVETWGRRQLAYPVKKFKRGVYVYVQYVSGGGLVSELERNLRMLDEVIKFQTVLVSGEFDVAAAVDPERVKFDEIEPPPEDEVEESLERSLGLEEAPPPPREQHAPEHKADEKKAEDKKADDKKADEQTADEKKADEKKSESSTEEKPEDEE